MRIGYARTTIDRSTRTSVVISFGLVGRARSQSSCHRMDRVFVAEFEVAGSSFVGRSLADSRHATLLLFLCRGRDVSCVDFVSIIHPDYRPEPIRAAILYRSALITIRRRRAGSDLANAAPHSRIFGTDWNPTLRRDFARSRIIHNF